MAFDKREIILIIGILFLMIGMIPFIAPIYAAAIAVAIYFSIKVFVGRKKRLLQKITREGICDICSERIIDNKCPKCGNSPA